jgi:hypothetical protein
MKHEIYIEIIEMLFMINYEVFEMYGFGKNGNKICWRKFAEIYKINIE